MTLGQGHGHGDRTRAAGIALASLWPEIADPIPAEDREVAARVLTVPLLTSADATLSELMTAEAPTAFAFIVAEGVVFKETVFASRSALELLGPGDVLAPPLDPSLQAESRAISRYDAHGPASLAALDQRFTQAARRWPGLADLLHDRRGRQMHRASMHLAMLHQPRAEDRLLSLFVDLAERFGRMTPDGVIIELDLTHELIGRLIGARRPTVSLALSAVGMNGSLVRLDNGGWKVAAAAMTP